MEINITIDNYGTKTTAGSNDLTWDFYVYNAG